MNSDVQVGQAAPDHKVTGLYQPVAGRVVDYDHNGLLLRKLTASVVGGHNQLVQGKALTIFYQGFLSSSSHVYLHWGKNAWQNRGDEPMVKRPDVFWQTRITLTIDATQINLAFHDGSGHWDNNDGKDWNLAIRTAK